MSLVDSLPRFLYNLDLKIVEAESELELANIQLSTLINQKTKTYQESKIKQQAYQTFVKKLHELRNEVQARLDNILETYDPTRKKIWKMYFIERKSYEEIAQECDYSRQNIKYIVGKLKQEMEGYFD